eukprot:799529-Pyramimonas_sp.AAC.1
MTIRTCAKRVHSHGGPIRCRKRGYILTADQSDVGSAGTFSRQTNQMQEARAYSHGGPIRRRKRGKRGYILTADQSDAGSAGIFSRRTNRVTIRTHPEEVVRGVQRRRLPLASVAEGEDAVQRLEDNLAVHQPVVV